MNTALQSPARLSYSMGPAASLSYLGSFQRYKPWQPPVNSLWSNPIFCYHCTELKNLLLSLLHGSLPRFQDVDIAPQWLSDNSKFTFSKVKLRHSKCVQRLLDSTAITTTKKLPWGVTGPSLRVSPCFNFKKQKEALVPFSGSFVTDFSTSFAFNEEEKPLLLLHKTPGFTLAVWRLLLGYLNRLEILFTCCCLHTLIG